MPIGEFIDTHYAGDDEGFVVPVAGCRGEGARLHRALLTKDDGVVCTILPKESTPFPERISPMLKDDPS